MKNHRQRDNRQKWTKITGIRKIMATAASWEQLLQQLWLLWRTGYLHRHHPAKFSLVELCMSPFSPLENEMCSAHAPKLWNISRLCQKRIRTQGCSIKNAIEGRQISRYSRWCRPEHDTSDSVTSKLHEATDWSLKNSCWITHPS